MLSIMVPQLGRWYVPKVLTIRVDQATKDHYILTVGSNVTPSRGVRPDLRLLGDISLEIISSWFKGGNITQHKCSSAQNSNITSKVGTINRLRRGGTRKLKRQCK
jgi:hypothetical protein